MAADIMVFSLDRCNVHFPRDGSSLPFQLTGTLANSNVLLPAVSAVSLSLSLSLIRSDRKTNFFLEILTMSQVSARSRTAVGVRQTNFFLPDRF